MSEENLNRLQDRLQLIERQMNQVYGSIQELDRTKAALQALEGVDGGRVRLPLGAGIYVEASVDANQLLQEVGVNIFLPASTADAVKRLDEDLSNLRDQYQQLGTLAEETARALQQAYESSASTRA